MLFVQHSYLAYHHHLPVHLIITTSSYFYCVSPAVHINVPKPDGTINAVSFISTNLSGLTCLPYLAFSIHLTFTSSLYFTAFHKHLTAPSHKPDTTTPYPLYWHSLPCYLFFHHVLMNIQTPFLITVSPVNWVMAAALSLLPWMWRNSERLSY